MSTSGVEPTFNTLPIRSELKTAVASIGYSAMTPVQANCLPLILDGRDVIAQAETGSGKTAAFAIGLLNKLDLKNYTTQSLVLCPTRELADQVAGVIRQLSAAMANTKVLTLCGGKPMQAQLASLQRSPHIIVGTPGRILSHLKKESLNISHVQVAVLDEADRMLDMGFHEDISSIFSYLDSARQTLLFSATFPESIQEVSSDVQRNPIEIRVNSGTDSQSVTQVFYEVEQGKKIQSLVRVLQHHKPTSCIVFCNQKITCRELAEKLSGSGFYALELHGDLDQYQRDQALVQFDNRSCSLLIATDVAARGLDIEELGAVINYDVTPDPEVHIHRIGRTGRAGRLGLAVTLWQPDDANRIEAIEVYQNLTVEKKNIQALACSKDDPVQTEMVTLQIRGGRKEKIRPGDILGALTANSGLSGDQIGKITIGDKTSFVAVKREIARLALRTVSDGKIKGKKYRATLLG